jgi:hypothetical protein
MSIKGTINPQQGVVGKVKVLPANKTTIAAPNFTPKVNVAITDIYGANVVSRQDGDVLLYNAITGDFEAKALQEAQVNIENINGGRF